MFKQENKKFEWEEKTWPVQHVDQRIVLHGVHQQPQDGQVHRPQIHNSLPEKLSR